MSSNNNFWVAVGFIETTDKALLFAQDRYGEQWTGRIKRVGTCYQVELKPASLATLQTA